MRLLGVVLILVLCQCSTPHETREFPAFFRTDPAGYFNPSYVYERATLETRANELNSFERRRLIDLYEVELRHLAKDSKRFSSINAAIAKLEDRDQEVAERLAELRRDNFNASREPSSSGAIFVDPEFKKEYFNAYRLWNRDENEEALTKALLLSQHKKFEDLTDKERFKALNLQFRIALDVQSIDVAGRAYTAMKDIDDCTQETAEAGFLIALTYLAAGNPAKAKETFDEQCDPDETPSNLLKRQYWNARLREANGKLSADEYTKIADSPVPGYYTLMAHARLGQAMTTQTPDVSSYRKGPLKVSGEVERLFADAENSLRYSLRNDASTYLYRAVAELKDGAGPEQVPALLYTAHLFQAAGLQIEAMKIYAIVSEIGLAEENSVNFDFIGEMFPTPYKDHVTWVANEWNMDPDFLYAIMRQESAFNPGAVSPANARGLMQMMPFLGESIAKSWRYPYYGKNTLFFAKENMRFAACHLQQLQAQMPHPALMAASYNAGSKRVVNWWKRAAGLPLDVFVELIPIAETRNYVKLVMRNYTFYKLIRNGGKLEISAIPMRLPDPTSLTL